jgi:hypothetical protein
MPIHEHKVEVGYFAGTMLELCWNYADTGAKQSGIVAAQQQLQNDNSKQRYGIIDNSAALENVHH